jgi:hypothetical protein
MITLTHLLVVMNVVMKMLWHTEMNGNVLRFVENLEMLNIYRSS